MREGVARRLRVIGLVALLVHALPIQGSAQGHAPPYTANAADVLERAISISISNVLLGDALHELRRSKGVPLAWSGDIVPAGRRITVRFHETALRTVLSAMLSGSGLRVVVTRMGTIVVIPDSPPTPTTTGASLVAPLAAPQASIDVGLRSTGVQQLDQVVVMGSSVAGGPEHELPVAVQVVSAARLAERSQPRITDLVRSELPGLMLWDRGPTGPPAPFAAVRGVASFTTRALKTYVDGVELASPELFTLVDGRSIDGLEMIRGPQGAALYGPDALNGIVQIRTRHGVVGRKGWQSRLTAGGGMYERSDLALPQPAQDLSANVTGSSRRAAFDAAAAFSNVGRDSASRQLRSWNAHTGATALLGPVLIEASARAAVFEFAASRIAAATASPTIPQEIAEQAIALTATQQLTTRWRHSLVAGRHWISGDREPFRSPLLPPRLPAGATFERADRRSLRYASTVAVTDALEFSGGAETSVRRVDRELIRATVMNDLSALVAADLRARGAFAQTRLRIGSRFTLSGGARAERLSSVGPRQGIVWASTAGASWNRELPGATVRLRTAWGRGIRPPEPGMSVNRATSTLHQLANANLAPERQQGVEAGADLYFANGAFFKATWYQQFASDLLQQVSRRVLTGTADSYQFQNVGVVRNRGVELEGGLRMGPVTVGANAQWPNSEVRSLSSRYTGELRPGDKLLEVPEAAGSAYARMASGPRERKWSAEVGVTALGPWTGYDWLLLARIEGGQATRRDLLREYWMRYPGVVRPYVSASAHIARELHAYLRVDNPGNNSAFVRDNASPTLGRTAMAGVEIRAK